MDFACYFLEADILNLFRHCSDYREYFVGKDLKQKINFSSTIQKALNSDTWGLWNLFDNRSCLLCFEG